MADFNQVKSAMHSSTFKRRELIPQSIRTADSFFHFNLYVSRNAHFFILVIIIAVNNN
jgi:hypothetical protein